MDPLTDHQRKALLIIKKQSERIRELEAAAAAGTSYNEPIAIVGLACRFPGAPSTEAFWKLLRDGKDAITEVPRDRWDVDAFYDPDPGKPGTMTTRYGGFISSPADFDAPFFNLTPREAISVDPQQRLLLETAWEALEDARIPAQALAGTSTGVFIGLTDVDYAEIVAPTLDTLDVSAGTGCAPSFAAGRLSYVLGLQGPSNVVDTACSSSIVAMQQACQALRSGACNLAFAGGVHLMFTPRTYVFLSRSLALSPDGRSKAFDASADGFSRGEGCGVLVLKRLSDAQRDGDPIAAILRGIAVNHDGRSGGITVPNGPAQEKVIAQALAGAGLAPAQIDYLEAHGTGTRLGDPIEVRAAANVLGKGRDKATPLMIGSVKTNIGHLEAAAGMAGVIKTVLALQHEWLPKHLHFREPNPHIDWASLPVEVLTEGRVWPRSKRPRIASVSSFGLSGTNAHVILEEAPAPAVAQPVEEPVSFVALSAKTPDALNALAARYAVWLEQNPRLSLTAIASSTLSGRSHLETRAGIVADSTAQLTSRLRSLLAGETAKGIHRGHAETRPRIAWLFTGQGSQYPNMGKQLYETQPVFRATFDECAAAMEPELERTLTDVVFSADARDLNHTSYTQPALFALGMALARLWQSRGIEPDAVLGHSVGEYIAACVAGVFSLQDGARLIARRGRLMGSLPAIGAMAAVFASAAEVEEVLGGTAVSIAAYNRDHIVISGLRDEVGTLSARLEQRGHRIQPLNTSHAFHSALLDPMLDEFEAFVRTLPLSVPNIRFISNVTGAAISTDRPFDPAYWRQHARQPVRFLQSLAAFEGHVLLELGPQPILVGSSGLYSLRRGFSENETMQDALAQLYVRGAVPTVAPGSRIALPTYPFQRKRYWIGDERPASAATVKPRPQLTRQPDQLVNDLARSLARILYLEPHEVRPDRKFIDLGLDSVLAVEWAKELSDQFGINLKVTVLFDHPTLDQLSAHLQLQTGQYSHPAPTPTPPSQDDVAIIGISCRYPDAPNWRTFWDNLRAGRDSVTDVPSGRWPADGWFHHDPNHPETSYSRSGGFLDDVAGFDASFFGISRIEAEYMDPQQRIFLEQSWRALEDSAIAPLSLKGKRCSVYSGAAGSDYNQQSRRAKLHRQSMTGSAASILAARIAYFLDLRGAALAIDTACSSSLVAVHLACEDLRRGDSDLSLAGGVMVMNTPALHVQTSKFSMMARDGKCRTFDANATGSIWAEGCGVVVLKLLTRAVADGDHIYGVIKGSGINQDGATNGITAPSAASQVELQRAVHKRFSIDPASIGMVEAHGTATPLGDPIELDALNQTFTGAPLHSVALGSVKTNIGHAATAAGIAGLIKAALCLKYQTLVPSLHFETPNPHIDFDRSPFYVNTSLTPWKQASPRRAAINSFGFSGTNAHVVLEEWPDVRPASSSATPCVLHLSAKTPAALEALTDEYIHWFLASPEANLADVCHTAQLGRDRFPVHASYRISSIPQAIETLRARTRTTESPESTPPAGRRISLPTYAFQHERYWNEPEFEPQPVQTAPAAPSAPHKRSLSTPVAATPKQEVPLSPKRTLSSLATTTSTPPPAAPSLNHPLLGNHAADATAFTTHLSIETHPILRDHIVQDRFLVSSSVYISLLIAASKSFPCTLSRLTFAKPLTLERGKTVEVKVDHSTSLDRREWHISSRAQNPWEVNASAFVLPLHSIPHTSPLEDIRTRCPEQIDAPDVYATTEKAGLELGPSGQWIEELWRGEREAICRMARPWEITDISGWIAHPGLLDSCFACLFTLLPPQTMIPTGVDAFTLFRSLEAEQMWCHARVLPDGSGAITLLQPDGAALAAFDGIRFITLQQAPSVGTEAPSLNALNSIASIGAIVLTELAAVLGESEDKIDTSRGFYEHGMDSVMAVELRNRLQLRLGRFDTLSSTLAFDYPSVNALTRHLAEEYAVAAEPAPIEVPPVSPPPADNAIAIVGMACRFPGAPDVDALWTLLEQGTDAIRQIPLERWDVEEFYHPDPDVPGKMTTRFGGFIEDIDQFDQQLFGIAPREAESMDPQHRLLLETTWEALERAGMGPRNLAGSRTGVFVGISTGDYAHLLSSRGEHAIDAYLGTGTAHSTGVGRVSYALGLEGPNLAIDTACSSSLVAVHQACQSLRLGESDMALAGGVNAMLVPSVTIAFSKARMLAPDGRSKSFDAAADGYARGEGCGVVVLKRLADAQRDADPILAIIRGSAVNQDGASSGPTVPNGPAQERVLRTALQQAGCQPHEISYLEAHGTGTPLGDPIEVRAAAAVYGTQRETPLLLGTIKANVGHLEAAAGVAGLIKVVLAMRHQQIPPQVHFTRGNPHIDWDRIAVKVVTEPTDWNDPIKLAGVSSFGFSGTNAHVVVQSAPAAAPSQLKAPAGPQVLLLSARGIEALRALSQRYLDWLERNPQVELADLCYSAVVSRSHLEERAAILCNSLDEAKTGLQALSANQPFAGLHRGFARNISEDSPTASTSPNDLARAYVAGGTPNPGAWSGYKIPLPVYAFQRKRFWFQEKPLALSTEENLLYGIHWRAIPIVSPAGTGTWKILGDTTLFGDRLSLGDGPLRGTVYIAGRESPFALTEKLSALAGPLYIVTRGAYALPGDTTVSPDQRMFWGLGKSLSLERPELWGGLIDLPAEPTANFSHVLIAQLLADDAEDQVALRSSGRFVARLAAITPVQTSPLIISSDGTYLITGGTGTVGLRLADWLLRHGARNIVLAGRTRPTNLRAHLRFYQVDIADPAQVDGMIASLGTLRGVIHAAGVLEEGQLGHQTRASFDTVLAAKATGAWNLHRATANHPLDLFICISSIAAVWGSPGQGAYAAANAYLDALATMRQAQGLPSLSVSFGPWTAGGMAHTRADEALARQGIRPLGTARALASMTSLLTTGNAEGVVADVDWPLFHAVYSARRQRPLLAELPQDIAASSPPTGPSLRAQLAAIPPAERGKLLESRLREIAGAVLRVPPAEIHAEMGFASMGLDSLMAVDLRKHIQQAVGPELSLDTTLAFDYPNLRELTDYLVACFDPSESSPEKDLTEDDLDALIAQEATEALQHG